MGVVSALMKFGGIECSVADAWWQNPMSEAVSLLAYVMLIAYFLDLEISFPLRVMLACLLP